MMRGFDPRGIWYNEPNKKRRHWASVTRAAVWKVRVASKEPKRIEPHLLPASIRGGRSTAKYKRGKFIFRQGEAADAVFYIQNGKVQITVVSDQGKEGVIGMLEAGEFLGEGCLAGQPLHMASASAMAESTIVRIEKMR
jgi:CRP/FNR family transcriptional regulator, cyclic AMP receptor protein